MAGAWIGGVIDTGAVVAAGEVLGKKAALQSAALVKMAQNVLIGFAAFLLAIWATLSLEKKSSAERPSLAEVWFRFPKFIIGFVVSSIVISFVVEASMGEKAAKSISGLCQSYRTWFFAICFVCIGLETRVKDLISVGAAVRPSLTLGQGFNIIWTLIVFIFSGQVALHPAHPARLMFNSSPSETPFFPSPWEGEGGGDSGPEFQGFLFSSPPPLEPFKVQGFVLHPAGSGSGRDTRARWAPRPWSRR
jgi:Na+/glutamate symporter